MTDKLQALYDGLKDSYDLGNIDEFRNKMNDETKRRAFYDAVSPDYDLGDYDSFNQKLGYSNNVEETTEANRQMVDSITPVSTPEVSPQFKADDSFLTDEDRESVADTAKMSWREARKLSQAAQGIAGQRPTAESSKAAMDYINANRESASRMEEIENLNQQRRIEAAEPVAEAFRTLSEDYKEQAKEFRNESQQLEKDYFALTQAARDYATSKFGPQPTKLDSKEGWGKAYMDYLNNNDPDKIYERYNNHKERVSRDNTVTFLEHMANQTRRRANQTLKQAEKGTVGRTVSGVGYGLSQPGSWSLGMSDLWTAENVISLANKLKDGKELTDYEQAALDAYGTYMEASSILREYDTRGFKAGETTGEMLPFMVQMALNPAGKMGTTLAQKGVKKAVMNAAKGSSKEAAEAVAEQAMREYGTMATRDLLRNYGVDGAMARIPIAVRKVGGDLAASAVLANTLQAGSTLNNIAERKYGAPVQDGGHYTFDPEQEKSWAEAAYKGELSSIIENFTEMMGEWRVLGLADKMSKFGSNSVGRIVRAMGDTDFAKGLGKVLQDAHWSGTIGEMLEEEYGIILNSLLTGDNKVSDLWDLDQQIDIFLGVGLFGGVMGGAKMAAYPMAYVNSKKKLEEVTNYNQENITDWAKIQDAIDNADNNGLAGIIGSALHDRENGTDNGKAEAILNYIDALQRYRGVTIARDMLPADADAKTMQAFYLQGYDGADKQAVSAAYQHRKSQMELMNPGITDILDKEGIDVTVKDENGNIVPLFEGEYRQMALDYLDAKAAYDGMLDGITDRAQTKARAAEAIVRSNDNNGQQIEATTRTGESVHIISGDVIMDDGAANLDQSSKSIVIRHEDGTKEMVSPLFIKSVDLTTDTETAATMAAQRAAQESVLVESQEAEIPDADTGMQAMADNELGQQRGIEQADYQIGDEVALPDGIVGRVNLGIGQTEDGTVEVIWNTPEGEKVGHYTADQLYNMQHPAQAAPEIVQDENVQNTESAAMPTAEQQAYDEWIAKHGDNALNKLNQTRAYAEKELAARQEELNKVQTELDNLPDVEDEAITKKKAELEKKQADLQASIDNYSAVLDKMNAIQSVYDAQNQESATEQKNDAIRNRAAEWEKNTGVKVTILERLEDVPNDIARQKIEAGEDVKGWFENGQVYVYLPNASSTQDFDQTFIHEVIAHKGLKEMLGAKVYAKLCQQVWDQLMTEAQKKEYLALVSHVKGEQAQQLAAADEFIAYFAEKMTLNPTAEDMTTWQQFVQMLVDLLNKVFGTQVTEQDLSELLIDSLTRYQMQVKAQEAKVKPKKAPKKKVKKVNKPTDFQNMRKAIEDVIDEMDFETQVRYAVSKLGHSIVWDNDPNTRTKGLGSHIIATKGGASEQDRRKYFAWEKARRNGGLYPEEIAERIMADMPESITEGYDTRDVLRIILDAITGSTSPSDVVKQVYQDLIERQEKAEREEAERQQEAYAKEKGFDSYEEYAIFESGEDIVPITDEEQEQLDNILYGEAANGSPVNGVQGMVQPTAGQESADSGSNAVGQGEGSNLPLNGSRTGGSEAGRDNVLPGAEGQVIQGLEGYSLQDIQDIILNHIADAFQGEFPEGFQVNNIGIIGSRANGTAREDSDLDVLLEYEGDISEDALFDALQGLEIDGIKVDINPITPGKSGTIQEFLERNKDYKKEQSNEETEKARDFIKGTGKAWRDKPLTTLAEVKWFMNWIGYNGGLSKIMTGENGKKFVKFQANGSVTPSIYLGETTPREILKQFLLYGNIMNVSVPSDIQKEFETEQAAAKKTSDALWADDREQIKNILTEAGIPFADVIDSERGSRIVFTDRKNDNGNYLDYMDVSDAEQAKDDIEFIRAASEKYNPAKPLTDEQVEAIAFVEGKTPEQVRKENTEAIQGELFRETPQNTSLDDVLFRIDVNHNSPYLLKKADGAFIDPISGERLGFDTRFMGSGEGNQAHGYGSYFSVKDLREYAGKENPRNTFLNLRYKGQWYKREEAEDLFTAYDLIQSEGTVAKALRKAEKFLDNAQNWGIGDEAVNTWKRVTDLMRNSGMRKADFKAEWRPNPGHHYDVTIPDNNGTNYLEEMQTLRKSQRRRIADAVRNLEGEPAKSVKFVDYKNGWNSLADMIEREQWAYLEIRDRLVQAFGGRRVDEKRVSELMNSIGFDGIHYNGSWDGECYVIFNPEDAQIVDHVMFRQGNVTPEQDNEYKKAYEEGNTEKAEQMVKDAFIAKYPKTKVVLANGEPQVVYHGTPSPAFTEFAEPGVNLQGMIWLSQEEEYAITYAYDFNVEESKEYGEPNAPQKNGVYKLFANIVNPLNIGDVEDVVGSDTWNELAEKLGMTPEELFNRIGWDGSKYEDSVKQADAIYELTRGAKFVNLLKEKGYDGVEAVEGDDHVATFGAVNSSQVKSAEPFVLDNNGNLIPLSERFNPANNDVRFRQANDRASLMGAHNISEEKLKKVLNVGGLANPSMAIVDTDKYIHQGYGDISLIPYSSTLDASKRRGVVTYNGDAWSPTYPGTKRILTSKGENKLRRLARKLAGKNEELYNNILNDFWAYADDNYTRLAVPYLLSKGEKVEIQKEKPTYSREYAKEVAKALGVDEINTDVVNLRELTPEQNKALFDLLIKKHNEEVEDKAKDMKDKERADAFRKLLNETYREKLADEEGNLYFNVWNNLLYSLWRSEMRHKNARTDWNATRDMALRQIEDKDDYWKWIGNLLTDEEWPEKLYAGTDNEGRPRYIPNTLENASHLMRRDKDLNSYDQNGYSATKSLLLRKMRTLSDIRRMKDQLTSAEGEKEEKDEMFDEWFDVVKQLSNMQKISDNQYSNNDYAEYRLQEAILKSNPVKYLNEEYGYDIDENSEFAKQLKSAIERMKNSPVKYFETKFNRPVYLNEFKHAIVPDNIDPEIRSGLTQAGIKVTEYESGNNEDYENKVREATEGDNDVRFRVANADQEIFVSNAERAVESINQEKATPQQWLAMIQKQGGIKAGEDKWLRLSQWLQEQKSKTMTKGEILEFIDKNKIKIEEQLYSENPSDARDLEEYYPGWFEAFYEDSYEGPGDESIEWRISDLEKAVELYNANNSIAVQIDIDENGEISDDEFDEILDWAQEAYRDTPMTERGINPTRLSYTTEGLTNKREIALTVPAVDPWNQYDQIHFGDADNGRAIAWIRFGDAKGEIKQVPIDRHVDAFNEPVENVDHNLLYFPKGSNRFSVEYVIYGKLRNGEKGYVVAVNDGNKHIGPFDTLDEAKDALNKWYDENPKYRKTSDDILVIDEIQSNRHQQGRERGYQDESVIRKHQELKDARDKAEETLDNFRHEMYDNYGLNYLIHGDDESQAYNQLKEVITKEDNDKHNELREAYSNAVDALFDYERNYYNPNQKLIPNAPFEKNWSELAMKRMLRLAAEEGYDKIAWTTGDQQSERYNIGGYLSSIKRRESNDINEMEFALNLNGANSQYITTDKNGNVVYSLVTEFRDRNLAEIIGKELAEKALALKENEEMDTDDITISNSGMATFYDKMLVNFMNKYGKQWGVKVETVDIPGISESNWENAGDGLTMHSVEVTPEMRRDVLEGQVMFRVANEKNKEVNTPEPELNEDIMFRVSNRDRETISKWLSKRTDLTEPERNKVLDYIDTLDDKKIQLATGWWFAKGSIRIPEDMPKVEQAVQVANVAKVDPMQYSSPMELINAHANIEIKEKPINPDDVETLHKYRELPDGIVVYDVDDTEESRENMRRIIDTHFGKESSPWCLLQGDGEGGLTRQSKEYWDYYNSYPKQVAFKNGKLLAFSANRGPVRWWDRMDEPHVGIPVEGKIPNDELGRTGVMEYDPIDGEATVVGDMWKGNPDNGPFETYYDTGQLRRRSTRKDTFDVGPVEVWHKNGQKSAEFTNNELGNTEGEFKTWYPNGQLHTTGTMVNGRPVGVHETYFENGQLEMRTVYPNTWKGNEHPIEPRERFYPNGQIRSIEPYDENGIKNGTETEWFEDGQKEYEVEYVNNEPKSSIHWFQNGDVESKKQWDEDGHKTGVWEKYRWDWDKKKSVPQERTTYRNGAKNGIYEEYYPNGQMKMQTNFKDGNAEGLTETWNEDGKPFLRSVQKDRKEIGHEYYDYDNNEVVQMYTMRNGAGEPHNYVRRLPMEGYTPLTEEELGTYPGWAREEILADPTMFRVVKDKKELNKLNNDPKGYVDAYASMAKIDGKYYPPMAAQIKDETGKTVKAEPMEIGDWTEAEERTKDDPNIRVNEDGKWEYHLIKPDGKDLWVAYNPYAHSTLSPLNDQFTAAHARPELVMVKVRIPKSDLDGYQAEGAKDSVGETPWHSGPVSAKLKGTEDERKVILSRYRQLVEEVPVEEEAKAIADVLSRHDNIAMPINVVRPQLREELGKLGVKFGPIKGSVSKEDRKELNKILKDMSDVRFREGENTLFSQEEMQGNVNSSRENGIFASNTQNNERRESDIQREGNQNRPEDTGRRTDAVSAAQPEEIVKPLRKLEEGETCHVERKLSETGDFSFIGKDKIETIEDVAYIFRKLETKNIENAFIAFVKNGKATVLHVGMGTISRTMVDLTPITVMMKDIKPDMVYFIHNHPSGQLVSSNPDRQIWQDMKRIMGDRLAPGIIIDTTRNEYGMFEGDASLNNTGEFTENSEGNEKIPVYRFDERVFSKDYNPKDDRIRNSRDITEFVCSHRLGERDKISVLCLDHGNKILGNFFLPYTDLSSADIIKKIAVDSAYYAGKCGASGIVLYGNGVEPGGNNLAALALRTFKEFFTANQLALIDIVGCYNDDSGSYYSYADHGNLAEPSAEYSAAESVRENALERAAAAETVDSEASLNEVGKLLDDSKKGTPEYETYNSIYTQAASGKSVREAKQAIINEFENVSETPVERSMEQEAALFAQPVADLAGVRFRISTEPSQIRSEYNGGDIVVYNPKNVADVQAAVMRESYTHKDIRNVPNWEDMTDTAYRLSDGEIATKAIRNGMDFDAATEEWMYENAERMVVPFERMMAKNGVNFIYRMTGDEIRMYLTKTNGLLDDADLFLAKEELPTEESLRFRTSSNPTTPRDVYDASQESLANKLYRSYIDYTKPVRDLQELIAKESGSPIEDFENAWEAENQRSSKSKAEIEKFELEHFEKMRDAVRALEEATGMNYKDVLEYLIAKHGLERNEVLAMRDAEAEFKKYQEENPTGTKTVDDFYKKNRKKDYSGLTSLSGEKKVADAEDYAKAVVDAVESAAQDEADALWRAIDETVKAIQKKRYQSGLISKDQMQHEADMFDNYIPLRGFAETIAEDVYDYYEDTQRNRPQRDRKAEGRTSLADDPLATLGAMAASAIMQGNKNLVKQRFLNMVQNHKNEIATVKDVWVVNHGTPTNPVWEPEYPDIHEGMDADDIRNELESYSQRMEQMEAIGMAKKAKNKLNIKWRTLGAQAQQHIITVRRNGEEQMIIINGNPQVARTMNGINNPDANLSNFMRGVRSVQRFMAANFTTRNPAFVVSNLCRDLGFALMAVGAKENETYRHQFMKNIMGVVGKTVKMGTLIRKWQNGTLDMNDEVESYFAEFMDNGGETGYTAENTVDAFRKKMEKGLKNQNWAAKSGEALLDFFELCNRSVEDFTRFMTFMTSRQMGRTVQRSVADAKNITVNFNRKGSGEMGQKYIASAYLFLNAGIQSLQNVAKICGINLSMGEKGIKLNINGKKLTEGAAILFGSQIILGFLVPMLNEFMMGLIGGDDDDEPMVDENGVVISTNPYRRLTEWERRNNLCIWLGGNRFAKIPLAIELRAFYGLGETMYGYMAGIPNPNPGADVVGQMLDLLPVNFVENGGMVPDAIAPIWESFISNKNYQGIPLYNDSDFLENNPEASKAYSGTGPMYMAISRWVNELGGGDDVHKSKLDTRLTNPAIMQHIVEGYLGGLLTTTRQTAKLIGQPIEKFILGKDVESIPARDWPVVNRLYINTDKRNDDRYVKDRYYFYRDKAEQMRHDVREYEKRLDDPRYVEKYQDLITSPDYLEYITFDALNKAVKDAHQDVKEFGDEFKVFEVDAMRELVNALDEDSEGFISPEQWGKDLKNIGE